MIRMTLMPPITDRLTNAFIKVLVSCLSFPHCLTPANATPSVSCQPDETPWIYIHRRSGRTGLHFTVRISTYQKTTIAPSSPTAHATNIFDPLPLPWPLRL